MNITRRLFIVSLGILAVQLALVATYLRLENTVHFWDYAMYARMAQDWGALPGLTFKFQALFKSFSHNYNLLFSVPLAFFFTFFGASRDIFILLNAVFFLVPAQIGLGFIARRLYGWSLPQSVLTAQGLSLLIPALWIPLVQGYPDLAAAACLHAAFYWALDEKRNRRARIGLGAALAFAVIFRRHFAYPSLALMLADSCIGCLQIYKNTLSVRRVALSCVVTGFTALVILGCVEPLYLKEMLTTDFTALYAAYTRTPSEYTVYFLSRLGILSGLSTVFGLWFLWTRTPKARNAIGLGVFFIVFWLGLWISGPAQRGEHYLVGVLPLPCFLGLLGLWRAPRRWALIIGAALTLQTAFVFWPRASFMLPSDAPQIGFFATPRAPWRRTDMDQLAALARHIAQTTTPQDKILVAGSSFILNQDLIRAVFMDLVGDSKTPHRFIPIPETDSPGARPHDAFASANVYLVPNTPQYHLSPDGQKVITSLFSAFSAPLDIFEKDPVSFALERGVVVSVWRRRPWTGRALYDRLSLMNDPQRDTWIVTQGYPFGRVAQGSNGIGFIGSLGDPSPQISFFYNAPLLPGTYRLGFSVAHPASCTGPRILGTLVSSAGTILEKTEGSALLNPGLYYWTFSVAPHHKDSGFLFLSFLRQQQEMCPFLVSDLVFEKRPL